MSQESLQPYHYYFSYRITQFRHQCFGFGLGSGDSAPTTLQGTFRRYPRLDEYEVFFPVIFSTLLYSIKYTAAMLTIDSQGSSLLAGYFTPYSSTIHLQKTFHESSHFFLTFDFSAFVMQLCSMLHSARTLQPCKLMDCEPTIT